MAHPDDPVLDLIEDVPHGTQQVAIVWIDAEGRLHARWYGMKPGGCVTTLYEAADEICRQRIPLGPAPGPTTRQ